MSNLEQIDAHLDRLIEDLARSSRLVLITEPRDGLKALHGVMVDVCGAISLLRDEVAAARGLPRRVWEDRLPGVRL